MLLGRLEETARIDALLEGARCGRSAALIIRGEPGVGKSALLDYAADVAGGMRVLRCAGVESEAELAFAALHLVLRSGFRRHTSSRSASCRARRGRCCWSPPPRRPVTWPSCCAPPRHWG